MSKKIENMTREELQQMLDSFSRSVQHISEGHIDRVNALLSGQPQASINGGQTNKDSGWASKLGTEWGRTNMIEHMNKDGQCQHCKEITNIGNIEKYHKDGICLDRIKFEEMIVSLYESGMSIGKLVIEVNRDRASIYNILVNNNANIRQNQILTEDDVWDILVQLDNGVHRKELEKVYGVSKGSIAHIAQGRSWPNVQMKYKEYKSQTHGE